MQSKEYLREGDLKKTLEALQGEIRDNPAKPELRNFLFQLLCVLGQWDRAMTQLNVAAEMNSESSLMAHLCRPALNCEALRAQIFSGERSPVVFGEPAEWVALLLQVLPLLEKNKLEAAAELRDRALESAPAISGSIDGKAFEWIADADSRLGPVLEAIVEGHYYWIPFSNISDIVIEEPVDLRDAVWAPCYFTWVNGGKTVGLIPVRYFGSELCEDDSIKLARKTDWKDAGSGFYLGLGQRMLATDADEYPLLETRHIILDHPQQEETGEE